MWLIYLQADLYSQYRDATGFTFKTQYYYLSWGKTGHVNDLILGTYINRTDRPPRLDAQKNIVKPERVSPGGISMHFAEPRKAM